MNQSSVPDVLGWANSSCATVKSVKQSKLRRPFWKHWWQRLVKGSKLKPVPIAYLRVTKQGDPRRPQPSISLAIVLDIALRLSEFSLLSDNCSASRETNRVSGFGYASTTSQPNRLPQFAPLFCLPGHFSWEGRKARFLGPRVEG